jgi:ubiquinone biosynthesis protein
MALEELGTTFVKMGQILSTRTDILPSDYTQELSKLQNSLEPLHLDVVEKIIKEELGRTVSEVFSSFDQLPLGVASIGQAHGATLKDGSEVVVKVRKPGVPEQVTQDLEILRQLADAAEGGIGVGQYDFSRLIEEIADTLNAELDYVREGHSAEHFATLFQDDPTVHIPKVFWKYTTPRVLTLERIKGTGINDVPALTAAGFDLKELAKRSINIWMKMIFEDGVFHADPHPGNLFVEPDGRLGLVDFGITGLMDDEVRDHLVSAIKGILDRDVNLVVESLMDMGAVAPTGSMDNLRRDLKHVMGHYPALMEDMHISSNIGELFAVTRRNYVQLPANTFLLLKTMAMVQGLGRGLDPDLDFFALLIPNVEQVLKKKYAPSALLKRLPAAAGQLAMFGMGLPARLMRIARSIERGELKIRTDLSGVEHHMEHLERLVNRAILGIIVAAIIMALGLVFLALNIR